MGAVSASVWKLRASYKFSKPIKSSGVGQHLSVKGSGNEVTAADAPFIATQYRRRDLPGGASAFGALVLIAGAAEVFMVDLLIFGNSCRVRVQECLPRAGEAITWPVFLFCSALLQVMLTSLTRTELVKA
jgi:hypothetical protein